MTRAQHSHAAPGAARASGPETVVVHGADAHLRLGARPGAVDRTATTELTR
ncbi:MAG: hypothetical protein M3P31_01790 [Actinomycetota bacterium]|nr:hypothetical protein [Actinomycetota bacterium]